MNTEGRKGLKTRGSADISYLGRYVDEMIWEFMEKRGIPGLTLAIVQAPYIPRVAGYGFSSAKERRLASVNTMWPAGPISQAFAAVALMQLHERGALNVEERAAKYMPELPAAWNGITLLELLRHASGIADYHKRQGWNAAEGFDFTKAVTLVKDIPLAFAPGSGVELSATNFAILTEVIERVSGMGYHAFVKKNQIDFLGLRRTAFAEELDEFPQEDVSLTGNVHERFKKDPLRIDPAETAASYGADGEKIAPEAVSSLRGFSDVWASAQDISFWDIGLASTALIGRAENKALVYSPWKLPGGEIVPAVAGWHFYGHRGLMDIKGSVPGYSSFLSRFTDASELVCVTLMANREGVDFTNLGRRIAAAFGGTIATNYDDGRLFLYEGQFSVEESAARLERELKKRGIPLFAKFDHRKNAEEVGMELRPTTVLVFGSPKVGTNLMLADQSISLDLPLRISIWEDEKGCTWLAFPRMELLASAYGLEDHPVTGRIEALLEELTVAAGSVY